MARSPLGAVGTISMIIVPRVRVLLDRRIWTYGGFFFGWPYFWGFPHWIGIVVFFMVLRMIFMPFRMARVSIRLRALWAVRPVRSSASRMAVDVARHDVVRGDDLRHLGRVPLHSGISHVHPRLPDVVDNDGFHV